MKYYKQNGFTLIELLIAMFLFAVIATFLIPKVTKDAEKQLFTTQLVKVQSDVQQAFLMMITKNQNSLAGFCSGAGASKCLIQMIGQHLEHNTIFNKASKADDTENNKAKDPGAQSTAFQNRKPVFMNKITHANYLVNGDDFQAIYLKNGAYVSVFYNPVCDTDKYDIGNTNNNTNVCGYIEIDVNAGKVPNMVGKDIHYFWIHPTDGIIPFGEIDDFTCENVKETPDSSEEKVQDYKNGTLGCTFEVIEKQKITYY